MKASDKIPLESHMAHFWRNIKTEEYRRQLKAFWTEFYGESMMNKVIELAGKK